MFFVFGASFLAPLIYLAVHYNAQNALPLDPGHLFTVAAIYAVGTIIYLAQVPERWLKNGEVDYIGHSHNIWHVIILIGLTVDMVYSYKLYESRL